MKKLTIISALLIFGCYSPIDKNKEKNVLTKRDKIDEIQILNKKEIIDSTVFSQIPKRKMNYSGFKEFHLVLYSNYLYYFRFDQSGYRAIEKGTYYVIDDTLVLNAPIDSLERRFLFVKHYRNADFITNLGHMKSNYLKSKNLNIDLNLCNY